MADKVALFFFTLIKNNDMNYLRKYLQSKWYNVRDERGNTLLQAAIHPDRKEIFDYILSLDGFPLESENYEGKTALELALRPQCYEKRNDFVYRKQYEYFALHLIKKGAKLHPTAIIDAVLASFVKVVELLLESGLDPNVPKNENAQTCLHMLNYLPEKADLAEMYFLLLSYGADPFVRDDYFQTAFQSLMTESPEYIESVIDLFIDEYSSLKIFLDTLVNIGDSPFCLRIASHIEEIDLVGMVCLPARLKFVQGLGDYQWFLPLFILMLSKKIRDFFSFTVNKQLSIETLGCFVEDHFGYNLTDFVATIRSNDFFINFLALGVNESTATGIICYLLSHGLNFNQFDLQLIYQKFGYCELFKIMLHMEFSMDYDPSFLFFNDKKFIAMPTLVYTHDLDIDTYLKATKDYKIEELLHYFVHPKLTQYCEESPDEELQLKVNKFPKVPLLKQLSRDVFRKFVIKKYELKTARQFYTFVQNLPVSSVHKRMITYETKLY